jgi:predicted ATP-binding protein involved in virulence
VSDERVVRPQLTRTVPHWMSRLVLWSDRDSAEVAVDPFYRNWMRVGAIAAVVGLVCAAIGFGLLILVGTRNPADIGPVVIAGLAFLMLIPAAAVWLVATVVLKVAWFARTRAIQEVRARSPVGTGEQTLEVDIARREDLEAAWFQRNCKQGFLLRSLSWSAMSSLEDGEWIFRPRINVLLGRNGYGKTLLLRMLATLIQRDRAQAQQLFGTLLSLPTATERPRCVLEVVRDGATERIVIDHSIFRDDVGKVPLLAIPDSRFLNRSNKTVAGTATGTEPLFQSGATNFLNQQPYEGVIQELLAQLAADYFANNKRLDQPLFQLIENVVRQLTDDQEFAFDSVERVGRVGYKILVRTEGQRHTPLTIQDASQGTLSIVAIFGLIYSFLESLHPTANDAEVRRAPGIVIIDELDAHLHPTWQRKILGLLAETFPNVQFIVAAHSPLVVAGCDWGEISVLRRPERGGFVLETIGHDFVGASAADVYNQIFEVDDRADRTYALYTTGRRSPEERQRELKRLEARRNLSAAERRTLEELRDEIIDEERLTARAAEVRQQRVQAARTEAHIKDLEGEIVRLQAELALRDQESTQRGDLTAR